MGQHLFRHGLRRATFPRGEGFAALNNNLPHQSSAAKSRIQPDAAFHYLLSFVFHVFCNVIQTAAQRSAQLVQGLGFHVIVGLQPPDGLAVDAAPFPELISRHMLFFHRFPQSIEFDHCAHPHLDIVHYGGYNPNY
jgi:hypothetical protein